MKKILIIEDEIDIRESLEDIVSANGYEVITASSGKEGLFIATTEKPDLILSDVLMPEMNGYELLEYIQENNLLTNVPFIFLTAKTEMESLRKGMNLGADDYLTKPVKMQVLLEVIAKRLKKAEDIKKHLEEQSKEILFNLNRSFSHEFNTPLNGILGFAQLMSKNPSLSPEQLKVFSEAILESGLRLKDTLDNILLYRTLLSQSKPNPNVISAINVEFLGVWTDHVAKKYSRTQDFIINDFKELIVKIDGTDLKKIYSELLDNAFKFSNFSDLVEISVSQDDAQCNIIITDKGRGMSAKQINEVVAFKQFDRKQHEQQGLGLGLFIATELLKIYQGHLEIANKSEGSGLQCTISIPK